MERLITQFDKQCVPKKLIHASSDIGMINDCSTCSGVCEEFLNKGCKKCPLQEVFNRLWEYEAAGLTPGQVKAAKWIPCSERMPDPEQEVEITYTRKNYKTGETMYLTARAFYEDGTLTEEDSDYCWENADNWEYDEKRDVYIIPEGWWEAVSFCEQSGVVDMPVIAWRPLAEPYTGKES